VSTPRQPPKWKRFEDLVAHIQATLTPGAVVEQNIKLKGRSGLERQIDICVRLTEGQFDLFIVIDCKDYNRKVNVNDVEAVMGLCKDVGANQGAIVTTRGFTDGATRRARDARMNLYTLIDAEKHEWQTLVTVPILFEVRGLESVQFSFSNSEPGPFHMSMHDVEHPLDMETFSPEGVLRGTIREILHEQWHGDKLPTDLGEHPQVRITPADTYIKSDEELFRLDVSAAIRVQQTLYVQQVPLAEIQGFKDELSGQIHTKRMKTERITGVDPIWWTPTLSQMSVEKVPHVEDGNEEAGPARPHARVQG
jgi:hypothetical protein